MVLHIVRASCDNMGLFQTQCCFVTLVLLAKQKLLVH